MAGIGGKAIKGVVKDVVAEAAETGAKASIKAQKGLYQRALDKAGAKILEGSDNIIDRAVNKNFGEAINSLKAKEARLGQAAKDGAKAGTKTGAKGADAVEDIVEEKVKSSRGKNALIGSAVGGISGAGIGGITGMATGADEDNQNGMIVTGALAGIAGGAMVGGLFGNNITKVAGGIAKGASNEAVEGGAKGLLKNVGASAQNFADKIDDVGGKVSKKLVNNKEKVLRNGVFDTLEKQGFSKIDAQELSHGVYGDSKIKDSLLSYTKTANTLGGAAQGAIMGSAGGALVGGVAGGIDEDDTFIGGALKGGLIGGAVGGIGGGVSGYFNNSAKILSNTTANVNSLLGK